MTTRWRSEGSQQVPTMLRTPTEEAVAGSEQRYRMLFEAIDEGFCVFEVLFDEDGNAVDYRFLETNPAFERHTGLRDAVGRTALELVPDLEPHWLEIYGRVAKTGQRERVVEESTAMGRWFGARTQGGGGASIEIRLPTTPDIDGASAD